MEALKDARAGLVDAVMLEDGLDGSDAESICKTIDAALALAKGDSPSPSATELADFREHQAESEYSHSDDAHPL